MSLGPSTIGPTSRDVLPQNEQVVTRRPRNPSSPSEPSPDPPPPPLGPVGPLGPLGPLGPPGPPEPRVPPLLPRPPPDPEPAMLLASVEGSVNVRRAGNGVSLGVVIGSVVFLGGCVVMGNYRTRADTF